jgi:hypothetical protein
MVKVSLSVWRCFQAYDALVLLSESGLHGSDLNFTNMLLATVAIAMYPGLKPGYVIVQSIIISKFAYYIRGLRQNCALSLSEAEPPPSAVESFLFRAVFKQFNYSNRHKFLTTIPAH